MTTRTRRSLQAFYTSGAAPPAAGPGRRRPPHTRGYRACVRAGGAVGPWLQRPYNSVLHEYRRRGGARGPPGTRHPPSTRCAARALKRAPGYGTGVAASASMPLSMSVTIGVGRSASSASSAAIASSQRQRCRCRVAGIPSAQSTGTGHGVPKSVNSATSLPYATSGMADHAQAPEIGQFQHGGALPGRTMRARGRSTARHQPRDASVRWCASVPRQKPTWPARPKGVVWVGCTRATPLRSPTPGIRLA